MKYILFYIITICSFSFAQNRVGEWGVHLSYNEGNFVYKKGNVIYVGTKSQYYTYNLLDNSIESFSKLNNLNDIDVTAINFDNQTNTLIIGYENGNVDIVKNRQVINIPFIKNSANIIGSKTINNIHVSNGVAFLSCSFGLVKLNINQSEILDTYYFWNDGSYGEVIDCYVFNEIKNNDFLSNKIFVATNFGLFSSNINDPNLIDPNSWNQEYLIENGVNQQINTSFENGVKKILGSNENLVIFPNEYNDLGGGNGSCEILIYSKKKNRFISSAIPEICNQNEDIISGHIVNNEVMGYSYSKLFHVPSIENLTKQTQINTYSILPFNSQNNFKNLTFSKKQNENAYEVFFSHSNLGLVKFLLNENLNFEQNIIPNGPASNTFSDIEYNNDQIIISHGGKNSSWNNLYISKELSFYKNNSWSTTDEIKDLGIYDLQSIVNYENSLFVGSWNNGLLEFNEQELVNLYNENNSSLQSITSDGWIRVGGCCTENNLLWVTNSEAEKPISRFNNTNWESLNLSSVSTNTMIGKIFCLSNGQKWIQTRNEGIIVLANNGKNYIDKKITSSVSNGNLPSNTINAIAEDSNGYVWVGSTNGVGVFYSSENIFSNNDFDCETPLLEVDGYVERLLYNTNVLDLKIDGGNRKWIATEGKGVFLISEDGTEEIFHFTAENSPLLNNTVFNLEIDSKTGSVYFGTEAGLCSYRSTATDDAESFENVKIFPNPVKRNYSGLISIYGLTNDTNIKITDISGNLVYETQTEGGSASWNGRSFNGKKVKTGVYLFFCTNKDFTESLVKKVLIYN